MTVIRLHDMSKVEGIRPTVLQCQVITLSVHMRPLHRKLKH